MDKYDINLHRLEKATKLMALALKSGTLRDTDWKLASQGMIIGALHLLESGTQRQADYICGYHKSK